jgi:hypothetical protein
MREELANFMTIECDSLWWIGPEIRSAAEATASDWPSVTTADELTADMSLWILDFEQAEEIELLPEDRRSRRLKTLAKDLVAKIVAEHEYYSGNVLYSVPQVRSLLERGALTHRNKIGAEGPDLDEGSRFLASTHPMYARTIARVYLETKPLTDPGVLARAISALTEAMNATNRNRPENRTQK